MIVAPGRRGWEEGCHDFEREPRTLHVLAWQIAGVVSQPVQLLLSKLTLVVRHLPLCATGDTPLLYIAREGKASRSSEQLH